MKSKRRFNLFWVLYTILVFLPLAIVYTVFTCIVVFSMSLFGVRTRSMHGFISFWARVMLFLALSRVRVVGSDLIDREKSYIFLSNHQGAFDIFAIYGYLPNPFAWIMKMELRRIPMVGRACVTAGHVFIDRSSKMRSMRSIREAERILKDANRSVVMFPEGTRTTDGHVGTFKHGAFFMARDLHLPIVPLSVDGPFYIMPKGGWWIEPHNITLRIHEPIDTSALDKDNMQDYIDQTRNIIVADID